MPMRKVFSVFVVLLFGFALLFATTPPVLAQAPPNDDFDSATVIGGLPFSAAVNTSEATAAFDDPIDCTNNGSVWYAFTPTADMAIEANTSGSNYDTVLSVYTGVRGSLKQVACNDDFNGLQSLVSFHANGGVTYFFLIGFCCGSGGTGGGDLVFSVQEVPPAPNDNFANATPITDLPFGDIVNVAGSSIEPDEPSPTCDIPGDLTGSVWYAFTPATSATVTASAFGPLGPTLIAAYTGNNLLDLQQVGCRGQVLTFQANAGTLYYLQTGALFGGGGPLQFNLDVTPPPQAYFYYFPYDPSRLETIQFYDASFDPGGMGIAAQAWNFGDGTTADGCCPTHRYAADGDYSVTLTVTTSDGREGTNVQTVSVRTHDVAITKFLAPQSASAEQTRQIVVGVNSKLQPEQVTVDLYRSVPGGFAFVGTLTQSVPVRNANRTTDFQFSYTFTSEDASVGKVTFKAIATLSSARDALPADNEAVAAPTKVSGNKKGVQAAGTSEESPQQRVLLPLITN